jgi:DNA-binding beta-propeller fold protein YncE
MNRLRRGLTCLIVVAFLVLSSAAAAEAAAPAQASVGFEPIPLSLATDAAGHVYLSNIQWEKRVKQYSSDGELLASRGHFEATSGFVTRDITTDAAGNLWVADGAARKVVELGTDGGVLGSWSAQGRGIAIGPSGDVYLVEAKEVARYSADGTLISKWGPPNKPGGFAEAWGIAVGPDGLVYVADTYAERIEVFAADGTFVRGWAIDGEAARQPDYPYGIAIAPSGEVYVADAAGDRVQEFTSSGSVIRAWGGPGGTAGRFYTPTAIAVDPEGHVYVADAGEEYPDEGTARVQKFTADGRFLAQWGDVPPARPRLTAGPANTTRKDFAVFAFSSPEKGASFRCRLRGPSVAAAMKRLRGCSSPQRYVHLRPGRKVFEVFAVVEGRFGPTLRRAWTVFSRPGRNGR